MLHALRCSLLLWATLLFMACGPDAKTARVVGELKGIDQALLMAYVGGPATDAPARLDSIQLRRGEFRYERPCTAPSLLTLVYPNFATMTFVIEPGATVKLSGDANHLDAVELSGTESSELLNQFRQSTLGKPQADQERQAASFVRTHADSPAAIAVWHEHFALSPQLRQQPALSLLQLLRKAQPKSRLLGQLSEYLLPQLRTASGGKLPPFDLTTLDGRRLTQHLADDRPLVLLFTASWGSQLYHFTQTARRLERQYGQRAHFVYVIADAEIEQARSAAQRDTLRTAICDGQALSSPLYALFLPRRINSGVVIKRGGEIVGRDLGPDQLEAALTTALR